jgi:heptosyltransferase-3
MNRILVIRGGAIGDFILTLPTLKAVRDAYPKSEIEILGYNHIAELANQRFYANRVRSIEYGPLSRFFGKNLELPSDLADYFARFDLVINYLYDPDAVFAANLKRCGLENIVRGPAKLNEDNHAAQQLAQPLVELGLELQDSAARLFPSARDRAAAQEFMKDGPEPIVALHPGSGSQQKDWPIEKWIELGNGLLGSPNSCGSIVVVTGEADEVQAAALASAWQGPRVRFAKNLPLPHLAAVLEDAVFLGHDSGISHLAAAAGAKCILLFGPTNPEVWAPLNENVTVIRGPGGKLEEIHVSDVQKLL